VSDDFFATLSQPLRRIRRSHPRQTLPHEPASDYLNCQSLSPLSRSLPETASIVGTWQRKDKSLVEFKEDGTVIITATGKLIAKWQGWPQPGTPSPSSRPVCGSRLAATKTWTHHHYQRKLTIEHPGNGTETNLERVNKGPTGEPGRARLTLGAEDGSQGHRAARSRISSSACPRCKPKQLPSGRCTGRPRPLAEYQHASHQGARA